MERLKPDLAFALHAHQPVGNFGHVFEEITAESYLPFLEKFKQYPGAGRMGYHASGILYRWWEKYQPEMIDLLGELVDAGRIELLTGGFYEPILPLIPADDRQRQIEKHQDYLEERFGTRARGLWLTERVWIPELAADLDRAGLHYTIVDDFHFKLAGWSEDELAGYYSTEYNARNMGIFPISKKLRYRIPFHDVPRINNFLDEQEEINALTMADDAEKFGSWPDTQKWVYEDGWADRFFQSCVEGEINLCSPGEVFEKQPPSGRCYLPTASYEEMLEWAMPADNLRKYQEWKESLEEEDKKYARGGYFHNFLVKYEESNRLHKKMQWLSKNINKEENSGAVDNLLSSQCNDPYWHGVFGGLCLPHLRAEVWKNLTTATASSEVGPTTASAVDYDSDGSEEILYRDDSQFLIIDPQNGGELVTWELLSARRNLLDTLSRRWEAYLEKEPEEETDEADVQTIHHRETKIPAEWLENWSADPIPRAGFQVVSITGDFSPQLLQKNQNLEYPLHNRGPKNIDLSDDRLQLNFSQPDFDISYSFANNHLDWGAVNRNPEGWWGVMTTLGLRSPDKAECWLKCGDRRTGPKERQSTTGEKLTVTDTLAGYELTFSAKKELTFITYPVETLSRSEKDAEKIYQGTALLFLTDKEKIQLTSEWQGGT